MRKEGNYRSLPVLLVYNVDPAWTSKTHEEIHKQSEKLANCLRCYGHSVKLIPVSSPDLRTILSGFNTAEYILFNWCEELPGIKHSEFLAAKIFERMGFVYTGSSPKTLALSADKIKTRQILKQNGIPCPRWRVFHSAGKNGWNSFPAIVKAAFEHCSIGISNKSVVTNPAELYKRIAYVTEKYHQPAIVEDFIDGREFHVSIWGNNTLEMLPPLEKNFAGISNIRERLYTYHAKFITNSKAFRKIKTVVPAPLSHTEMKRLKMVATETYRAIGCRDYARIEIRLRDGIFYVLDVNPNPDLSIDCSLAYSARTAGFSYGAMNNRILNLAISRHPAFQQK
ncbi:MAG: ATP-grasp domain-containing protein [Kiritimatiellae bacterium]|nr:ATP-grasp domain-containing protein [Kiritimatiellia bacterium]MDD5521017.1 ATP-grasp domain-containing protein [Kiritimatiellia bacterium]